MSGLSEIRTSRRTLVLDRTNWKVGETHVNILVLAVATRHSQAPLMWTVLDRPGNSGAPERIALIERYIATFGKDSIGMLLADRVNGRVKVSQRAVQNVATLGLARLAHRRAPASGRPRLS